MEVSWASGKERGLVQVFLGPSYVGSDEYSDFSFQGWENGDEIGAPHRVALQDSNGDGFSDLWLASPQNDELTGEVAGGVYFLPAPFDPGIQLRVGEPHGTLFTSKSCEGMGRRLSSGGDLNGDGTLDLAVSAQALERGGSVYAVLGGFSYTGEAGEKLLIDDYAFRFDAASDEDRFGAYAVGYSTGTSEADWLLVGASHTLGGGATYVFQGPLDQGVYAADEADAVIPANLPGSTPLEGVFPAVGGDVDHDGEPDFVLPTLGEDNAGELFLFLRGDL